ncbi:MAG: hypothetical protein ACYDBB_11280 [Armatimonadota bacterium]
MTDTPHVKWHGSLILFVIVLIAAAVNAARGDWSSLTIIGILVAIVIVIAVITYLVTYYRTVKQLRLQRDNEEDAGPLTALVLLRATPRTLDEETVRGGVSRALSIRFDTADPQATEFVIAFPNNPLAAKHFGQDGQCFLLKVPQGLFMLNNLACPYTDIDGEAIADLPDLRLQGVLQQHQAWLSVDLLEAFSKESPREETYRTIGKILTALTDNECLGVYCPELGRCSELTPAVLETLASDDPLTIFGYPANVPVIKADEDSQLLSAPENG